MNLTIFRKNLPLFIGLVLFIATLVGTVFCYRLLNQQEQTKFKSATQQVERQILERMETYVNTLLQTRSMFYVTKEVDRKEFAQYVENLELLKKYPGVQGVGYTQKVLPSEVAKFEKSVRAEGIRDFKIWPATPRQEWFSIVYLEPLDWRNKRALGYDMFTNDVRRRAMETARDTGLAALSGPVELVQETAQDKQNGFLIYVPVFNISEKIQTVEGRRTQLKGFVYSPFRSKDFFNQVMEALNDLPVDVEVTYKDFPGIHIFDRYPQFTINKNSPHSREMILNIAQRDWIISISALPAFHSATPIYVTTLVFIFGSLLSLLVSYVLIKALRQANLLAERSYILEKLNEASRTLNSKLNLQEVLQTLTDIGKELIGSEFGAFFYNNIDASGESYMLYTVSGVPREKFSQFPMPRNTEVFGPTFAGKTLMSDDITKDPRYGKNAPYYGYPKDHLPVRSYLAVSVKSSTGEVIGALFYGHSLPGRFGELEKKLIEGLAPQAAIAIDNARLYQASERALASREEFVSIASHELKTPITSMSIQFQIAEKMINSNNARVYEPQAVTKRVKTALQQLARMTKLIEDMLDSSRIDMNKFKLNKNVFDFNLMIKSLLEKYAEQFQVENIEVTTSLPESPLMVNGDDYRLEQVVSNLINNAIKYGQHRPISITLSQTGGNVVLSVMDNGMGISPENLPRIFNRYERAISHSNISGLGLGLYISKMIVEAHGGTISAESVPEKGSVFKVVIPTE